MQATISIHRFKVYSHHGVMQQEHTVGGWFYVSLDVVTDVLPSAYLNDSLDGTVNYARLAEVIAQEMEIPSNLLEHVAHRLAHKLFACFPQIMELTVEIEKENPPLGIQCESVGVKLAQKR